MKTIKLISSAALAATLIAGATVAKANPELELISGTSSILVTAGASGTATFVGSIGQWSVNMTSGLNSLGGPGSPQIDVVSLNAANAYLAPLLPIEILYTAQETQSGRVVGTIGGTTTTSLTDYQWLGSSAFGKTLLLTSVGPLNASPVGTSTAVSGTGVGYTGPTTSYWLTEDVIIGGTSARPPQLTSFDANSTVTVPDGGTTMVMLGSLFAGIGALRSKFGSKLA